MPEPVAAAPIIDPTPEAALLAAADAVLATEKKTDTLPVTPTEGQKVEPTPEAAKVEPVKEKTEEELKAEEDAAAKADPQLRARLDMVTRTMARERKKLDAEKASLAAERQKLTESQPALAKLAELEAQLARLDIDPISVLAARGYKNWEPLARLGYERALGPDKTPLDLKVANASEQMQRELAARDERIKALEARDRERDATMEARATAAAYLSDMRAGLALDKLGDDKPVIRGYIEDGKAELVQENLRRIAIGYLERGELLPPEKLIEEYEIELQDTLPSVALAAFKNKKKSAPTAGEPQTAGALPNSAVASPTKARIPTDAERHAEALKIIEAAARGQPPV